MTADQRRQEVGRDLRQRKPRAPLDGNGLRDARGLMVLTFAVGGLVAVLQVASLVSDALDGHVLTELTLVGLAALIVLQSFFASRWSKAEKAHRAHGASAIEAALDCVIAIDGDGVVREWNRAASETFGYSKAEAIGQDLAELIVPPEARERHRQGVAECMRTGSHSILDKRLEVSAIHARGGKFPVELTVTRSQVDPPLFTAFVRDLSERRRREEENERLAAIVRSSEDAILSKDLDGVVTAWNKGAEALYGYTAEEAVGQRLIRLTIPPDRVAEIGALTRRVLEGGSVSLVTQRHTKRGDLLDVSLRAFPIRNLEREIVGVSVSAHDISVQLRREEQEAREGEQRLWRRRIEEALAHDRFVFWGQPVVDVRTGLVDHHELLLRMQLGDKVVSPFEFLPHAESCELITDIDRWAISRGAELGRHGRVAINLSAKGLMTPGLIGFVQRTLEMTGTPASNVLFEITETAAVQNLDAAHTLVEELKELGCGTALDDFGTGYGSFTYLKALPVTELKIDMSFVSGLVDDEVDQRIVKSIIHVAENFEMNTVAEGVEDEKTLNLLIDMGVNLVQGYHLGRPRPLTNDADLEAPALAVATNEASPLDPRGRSK